MSDQQIWAERLLELGFSVRKHLQQFIGNDASELTRRVGHHGGDTIYALDHKVEEVLVDEIRAWQQPLSLVAEGMGEDGTRSFCEGGQQSCHRLIVDPIDGTRSLMYDKRSAWFLAAIAPDHGGETRLSHLFAAAMVELPTSKQAWADDFIAVAGQGVTAWRRNLITGDKKQVQVQPSEATNLKDGFAQVSNFFPGTKRLASELMEEIAENNLGALNPNSADIFDDQYISTGGQMVELILGHDRFCCDLRPLFYDILTKESGQLVRGLECHPYDVVGVLVAQEAGVIITDGLGEPLDGPLDVDHGMHWCGYANTALREKIERVIQSWLERKMADSG